MRSLSKSGTPAPRGGTAISSIRRIMLLRGTVAIGRAICHEADHAGGRPPLFGKIKFEPLASALHQGPHGHPVTERCSTYIDAGQPASDRVVLVSPAFSHAATEHRLLGGGIGGGNVVRAAPSLPQKAIKARSCGTSSLTGYKIERVGVGCGSDQRRSKLAGQPVEVVKPTATRRGQVGTRRCSPTTCTSWFAR
jgi:hypothetical protein